MKAWVPLLIGLGIVGGLAFYLLSSTATGNSFELVNIVGLLCVVVGVVAAGVILRRTGPPR